MLINSYNQWNNCKDSLFQSKNKQSGKNKYIIQDPFIKPFDFSKEKENQLASRVAAKMSSGKKLTPDELDYLRRTDPKMYAKYLMMQQRKEILKKRLENCKSKQEVNNVICQEISMINKKDPDREMRINIIKEVEKEFKKTKRYKELPAKPEEEKNQNKKKKTS